MFVLEVCVNRLVSALIVFVSLSGFADPSAVPSAPLTEGLRNSVADKLLLSSNDMYWCEDVLTFCWRGKEEKPRVSFSGLRLVFEASVTVPIQWRANRIDERELQLSGFFGLGTNLIGDVLGLQIGAWGVAAAQDNYRLTNESPFRENLVSKELSVGRSLIVTGSVTALAGSVALGYARLLALDPNARVAGSNLPILDFMYFTFQPLSAIRQVARAFKETPKAATETPSAARPNQGAAP